jgi:hypothetical protein
MEGNKKLTYGSIWTLTENVSTKREENTARQAMEVVCVAHTLSTFEKLKRLISQTSAT